MQSESELLLFLEIFDLFLDITSGQTAYLNRPVYEDDLKYAAKINESISLCEAICSFNKEG